MQIYKDYLLKKYPDDKIIKFLIKEMRIMSFRELFLFGENYSTLVPNQKEFIGKIIDEDTILNNITTIDKKVILNLFIEEFINSKTRLNLFYNGHTKHQEEILLISFYQGIKQTEKHFFNGVEKIYLPSTAKRPGWIATTKKLILENPIKATFIGLGAIQQIMAPELGMTASVLDHIFSVGVGLLIGAKLVSARGDPDSNSGFFLIKDAFLIEQLKTQYYKTKPIKKLNRIQAEIAGDMVILKKAGGFLSLAPTLIYDKIFKTEKLKKYIKNSSLINAAFGEDDKIYNLTFEEEKINLKINNLINAKIESILINNSLNESIGIENKNQSFIEAGKTLKDGLSITEEPEVDTKTKPKFKI